MDRQAESVEEILTFDIPDDALEWAANAEPNVLTWIPCTHLPYDCGWHEKFMKRVLIIGVLLNSAMALCAQAQQPNTAKLKTDAQKVASSIRGDRAKTQAYCQINSLGGEIVVAVHTKDEQKADVLTKKINDLEKQLGPEYIALFDALNSADPNSQDFGDILSMFDSLDESCPR